MVATVQIDETNGAGPTGSETTNISNMNFGNVDAPNLVPATYPIPQAANSYVKYFRVHVTAMGGSNKIDNIQIWKSAGAYVTGEGIQTNLETSAYTAEDYATPVTTTYTHNVMPVADPAAANLGIGGSLSGSLVAAGYSDYFKMQLQTTGSTPAGNVNQKTISIQYDES
jgi:hypothetical protein